MNSRVEVQTSNAAAQTPAAALIYEAIHELAQEGCPPDEQGVSYPVDPQDTVIYGVSRDGDIVGVLTYSVQPLQAVARMTLGWVEPSSRRQGVFSELWNEFQMQAVAAGCTRITICSHAANKPLLAFLHKAGAEPATVTCGLSLNTRQR